MLKFPALWRRVPTTIVAFGCVSLFGQVVRGPYLQLGTPTSVVVKWRTNSATDSKVSYGADPAALTSSVTDGTSTTEHEMTVSGLTPNTKYVYSVGTTSGPLAGGDSDHYFVTSPPTGTEQPIRAWLIGDAGTANDNARAVRDAYQGFIGAENTDLLLMLGDNAYNEGTDAQYQAAVFDMYPQMLRNTVTWSTLGNHDGISANSSTQTGPYYDIFKLPTAGQAGGVASGTEAYYSFDYGNIHFICLDSHETPRALGGAMMTWLVADLQANTQPWVIAFWHHPPYTKGSHNSDQESQLIDMRTIALPIIEDYGVDLVFSGHSHSYERSFLLDGHYGDSTTFGPSMQKDAGSGQEENSGAYAKTTTINASHDGAVYTVAGSSGKVSTSGTLSHPAMYFSIAALGSVVLDVNGNRLDATFLDSNGTIQDYYTLLKGSDGTAPELIAAQATPDPTKVVAVFSEPLEPSSAETFSNYAIDLGVSVIGASLNADRRTVLLTTSPVPVGILHTMTVNGVTDHAANAVVNSSQSFQFEDVGTDPGMHVSNIAMMHKVTGRRQFSKATVSIRDEAGNPVPDAVVGGQWSGLSTNVQTLTTSSTGNVQFDSDRVLKQAVGNFILTVVSVIKAGLSYDETANVETSDCIDTDGAPCGPPDTDPPAAPTGLVATAGSLSVGLDWDDNGEGDLAGYQIFRSTVSGDFSDPAIAQIGATSAYTDTGLTAGTTYYYVVMAEDTSGNLSAASNEASAVPTAPTGAILHVENVQVQVIKRGKRYFGRAVATILDGAGIGVSSAAVEGTWTMPDGSSIPDTGTTDAAGIEVIDSPKVAALPSQSFAFTVTNVTHATIPYDSSADVTVTDSAVVP